MAPQFASRSARGAEPASEGAPRVLVAEGDADLAAALDYALELEGYRVDRAAGGVDALRRAAGVPPDVALLDLDLDDLPGPAALRAIQDLSDGAVVAMSSRLDAWRLDALSAGAAAAVPKPFQLQQLLDLLQASLLGDRRDGGGPGDVRRLDPGDLARLSRLGPRELDALPFGAIRLDERGTIEAFNAFEARAAGLEAPSVVGRRFLDVAPCVAVKEFVDVVGPEARRTALDRVLRFVFPHHGAACVVSVRLYREEGAEPTWLFVSKRRGAPGPSVPDADA